jgi:hypothetical protein
VGGMWWDHHRRAGAKPHWLGTHKFQLLPEHAHQNMTRKFEDCKTQISI